MASATSAVALDDLIALNDEILALARAGVPLEGSLIELGRDMPGRLGQLATDVGRRLQAGETLSQVLSANEPRFPPVYRAVVAAGVRAGRLPAALEGLAQTARRTADVRRVMGMAMVYPLLVLTLACGLFAVVGTRLAGMLVTTGQLHGVPVGFLASFASAVAPLRIWLWLPPLVAIVLAVAWWWQSGRGLCAPSHAWSRCVDWLPWIGPLLRTGCRATFVDVLATLLEQQVPLDEGLILAADASGEGRLRQEVAPLVERIRRGETSSAGQHGTAIPPLVVWLLQNPQQPRSLAGALRHVADSYYRQARYRSDWLRLYLPIALTVGIGGTATAVYALSVLGPWFSLLGKLGEQVAR